jgi:hypothetical protein
MKNFTGKNWVIPPQTTVDDLDAIWLKYVKSCDKLAEMRHADSAATEVQIEMQFQTTEKNLQKWINATQNFTATLN